MKRVVAGIAGIAIVLASLSGCGKSPYCKTVDEKKVVLDSLGEKQTDAAYVTYARAFRAVANLAPADIRPAWAKLADVTQDVVKAQQDAGIGLEDMTDFDLVEKVPPAKLKTLNDAYIAFNATQKERGAVVKNVKAECGIALS